MEEGSLLPIALEHARALRGETNVRNVVDGGGSSNDAHLIPSTTTVAEQKNCVVLDIFSVRHCCDIEEQLGSSSSSSSSSPTYMDHLLVLAELADRCNWYVQKNNQRPKQKPQHQPSTSASSGYLWHHGGDGPVFGITTTTTSSQSKGTVIPHLRAVCRYGPNIQDEWHAIELLRRLTTNNLEEKEQQQGDKNGGAFSDLLLAGCAWDVEDGQVILIQLADLLPTWVDESDPSDRHKYACWFVDGDLQLLDKPHIDLSQALREMRKNADIKNRSNNRTTRIKRSTHPTLNRAIKFWLELNSNSERALLSESEPSSQQSASLDQEQQQQQQSRNQRTPMVLPRSVAQFLQDRPELLHTAIQAYCELANNSSTLTSSGMISFLSQVSDLSRFDDWVWTKQSMSRTNYAMLRTVISIPYQSASSTSTTRTRTNDENDNTINSITWMTTPDGIPSINVQVRKKYVRQCKMDTTPHLRHAVSSGVRVVVGLQYLLMAQEPSISSPSSVLLSVSSKPPLESIQERIAHWTRIENEYKSSIDYRRRHHQQLETKEKAEASSTSTGLIMNSFLAGPNQSSIDLSSVLRCPVFPEESTHWITLFSNSQTSLSEQIRLGLKKQKSNVDDNDEIYWMPEPDQVDDDSWMDILSDPKSNNGKNQPDIVGDIHDVDRVLERFQNFVMKESSGIDGVEAMPSNQNESSSSSSSKKEPSTTKSSLKIRPRVFLNILHAVYKGEKLTFPKVSERKASTTEPGDEYFYDEDYALMEPDDDGSDCETADANSNEPKTGENKFTMRNIMEAMDSELNSRTESRKLDSKIDDDDDNEGDEKERKVTANEEDVHVLSNLLQSLEASAGQSGPVSNMLKEMESIKR